MCLKIFYLLKTEDMEVSQDGAKEVPKDDSNEGSEERGSGDRRREDGSKITETN